MAVSGLAQYAVACLQQDDRFVLFRSSPPSFSLSSFVVAVAVRRSLSLVSSCVCGVKMSVSCFSALIIESWSGGSFASVLLLFTARAISSTDCTITSVGSVVGMGALCGNDLSVSVMRLLLIPMIHTL